MNSIENIEYPKNVRAINKLYMNLPPVVVEDLMNEAYYFNDEKKTISLVKVLEANNVFKSLPETDRSRVIIRYVIIFIINEYAKQLIYETLTYLSFLF